MDERTGAIREEIEETRRRVGDEVDALSYKTDVGARLDDYVDEKKEAVRSTVGGMTHGVVSTADRVVPGSGSPRQRMRALSRTAERNPVGLAVAGAAVGFVVGLLLPTTDVEDEHLGELSDRVKETAGDTGAQALERGKDVARSAMETVQEEGAEQGRELAAELKDRVQSEGEREEATGRSTGAGA